MLRLHIEQAWCFLDSSLFLYTSLYPSVASDLPQQSRRLKLSRHWLYCWVLKVLMWQVEKSWRGVMWLPHSPQPFQSPSSTPLSPTCLPHTGSVSVVMSLLWAPPLLSNSPKVCFRLWGRFAHRHHNLILCLAPGSAAVWGNGLLTPQPPPCLDAVLSAVAAITVLIWLFE